MIVAVCARYCESDCRLRGVGKCDFTCAENYTLDANFECGTFVCISIRINTDGQIVPSSGSRGAWPKVRKHSRGHINKLYTARFNE